MPRFLHLMYATRGDMEPRLRRIEAKMSLDYVPTGMFDSDRILRYKSAIDLPNFGVSLLGDESLDPRYLVVPAGLDVCTRRVPQQHGGAKYIVDPRDNISTNIVFRPGGLFRNEALISGELGTPLKDSVSLDLFRLFYTELFADFVRIKVYNVGPEAFGLLRSGFRLTPGVKAAGRLDFGEALPVPVPTEGVWSPPPEDLER